MSKKLTIAIPTYNRADLLDKQLEWASNSTKGYESECDVLVSDNCSSDHTPNVIKKWGTAIPVLKAHRQPVNLGAIRNIAYCIKSTSNRFIWVLSDDDRMLTQSLDRILQYIDERPDLALLVLNYASRTGAGVLRSKRRFRLKNDDENANGKAMFEKYITKGGGTGALVFTSALVYRTKNAQQAIDEWPSGVRSLMYQLYVTGYCAMKGRVLVTKDTYLEFEGGSSFYLKDHKLHVQFTVADTPEIYAILAELGYSRDLCRELLKRRLKRPSIWIGLAKGLVIDTSITIKLLTRLIGAMRHLFIGSHSMKGNLKAYKH
ncbi:MAG: glycosyltransferase family 2 protein [Gammaproteobacteria bacterium]|nr:glycosyltransferase family 2 protein [Gammaproteobacteria bacterium]